MLGDGAARCGAEPDHEGSELLAPGAHRASGAGRWRRRASAALAAALLAAAALAACRAARAGRRTRGAEVAPAAEGAAGLVEARDLLEAVATERLEKMSTEELIKLAKKLQGEVSEIDDDMDLSVEEDPCKARRESARRLKAARLRRLRAEAESGEEEKEEFKELLEEEIEEIEGEEDPCTMPEEAFVKVEEVLDEEIEGTEAESQGARDEEEAQRRAGRGAVEVEAAGDSVARGRTAAKVSTEDLNLTHQHTAPPASAKCSASHEDCGSTRCCSDPGLQCYEKNRWWAMCRATCIPGAADPADVDPEAWSCRELGERSGGRPVGPEECRGAHDNCMASRCCKDPGFACFTKNDTFARCMPECAPGPQYFDLDNGDPWSCHQVGAAALSTVGNWTETNCSGDADDCRESRCCATSGLQCYEVGGKSARCFASCPQEGGSPCTELGYRTPPPPTELPSGPLGGRVGRWVKDSCSKDGEDCSGTSCCVSGGMQCYEKDSAHATCADECHANSTWSCKKLGTRSWGLAVVGYPSLFCVTFLRVDSYEPALVEYQWKKSAGIFSCDNFSIFADRVTTIAGRETLETPSMEVEVTRDGTAGNAGIFMRAWEMLFTEGSLWDHDWTVKADPDAVLLPDRLRRRLEPLTDNHGGHGGLFVVNCNAWPDTAVYPMMYGSVEVFSRAAMRQYMKHSEQCRTSLPWQEWGEDFFLTRCMDLIDVGRIEDFGLVGDDVCVGPGQQGAGECDDPSRAAFHPFKDIESWRRCYKNAIK